MPVCGTGQERIRHGERAAVAAEFLAALVSQLNGARPLLRIVLGGAIGVEREFREREAGLRTRMLVSVAALVTLTRRPTGSTTSWSMPWSSCSGPMRYVACRLSSTDELRLAVQLAAGASVSAVVNSLERLGVRSHSFELGAGDALDLLIELPRRVGPDVIVRQLATQQDVRSASWRT